MKKLLKSIFALALIGCSTIPAFADRAVPYGTTEEQYTTVYSGSNLRCAVDLYSQVNNNGNSIYILQSSVTPDFPYWVASKSVTVSGGTNVRFNVTVRGTKATPTDTFTAYHYY